VAGFVIEKRCFFEPFETGKEMPEDETKKREKNCNIPEKEAGPGREGKQMEGKCGTRLVFSERRFYAFVGERKSCGWDRKESGAGRKVCAEKERERGEKVVALRR